MDTNRKGVANGIKYNADCKADVLKLVDEIGVSAECRYASIGKTPAQTA